MSAGRRTVVVVAVVGWAFVCAVAGADSLRPEWSVGQEQVSPHDLQVIVPPAAPATLSLGDAIQLALRQNAGFRQSVQGLLAARSSWSVAQQRWALEAFGSVSRVGDGERIDESTAGASFAYATVTGADFSVTAELDRLGDEGDQRTLTASLRQPLLAGSWKASASYEQVRQARNAYRAALLFFFVARQALIEQVISSYFGAVEQKQLVAIQDASVQLAEQAVRDAEVRLREKVISEIDLTRAQLRLSREQTSAVGQRQSQQDGMDQLLLLLGLRVGDMPELVTTVVYAPEALDGEALIAQAMDWRPDLRLADLSLEDRRAVLRIARSERLPALDLFADWTELRNGLDERNWEVGLALSAPILSRPLREAVRQAQWDLLVSEQAKEGLKQQVVAEVRSQVRAAESAQANVGIAEQGVEVSNRSLLIAQRMVEEGLATNRDVLDAQDDKRRSESQLVSSRIDYYLALIRLRVAVGRDVMSALGGGEPPPPATEPTKPEGQPSS